MKKQTRKPRIQKSQPKLEHELFRFNLAGVQYSDYQKVDGQLSAGDELDLFWERDNKYDDRAIRVEWKGTKIGYVPKNTAEDVQAVLHNYREMGIKIKTYVVSINRNNPSWQYYVVKCASQRSAPSVTEPSF